jgi:hypothetical protein
MRAASNRRAMASAIVFDAVTFFAEKFEYPKKGVFQHNRPQTGDRCYISLDIAISIY